MCNCAECDSARKHTVVFGIGLQSTEAIYVAPVKCVRGGQRKVFGVENLLIDTDNEIRVVLTARRALPAQMGHRKTICFFRVSRVAYTKPTEVE